MTRLPPPLIYSAYLLLWGYYAHQTVLAVVLAAALEGSRWTRWRWELADRDFDRTVDLTNVLFVIATVYLFSRDGAHGIFSLVGWLPMLLFPLILVQSYSARGAIPAGALFLSLRRQRDRPGSGAFQPLDLSYPYLALCLVGAAAGVTEDRYFYPLLVCLVLWALAGVRTRGPHPALWLGALLTAGALGWAGQAALRSLQDSMEEMVLAWLGDRMWANTDPYQTVSAIGHIGRLKLSDNIVLHVTGLARNAPPLLLRQASYQRYAFGAWTAPSLEFESLSVGAGGSDWHLAPRPAGTPGTVGIAAAPRDGELLLALPPGTWQLDGLAAENLLRSPLGAVKTQGSPGFVLFEARSAGADRPDLPPMAGDLDVPRPYQTVIGQIAGELGLAGQDLRAAASRLERFFTRNFRYSLWQYERLWGAPPLERFLTTDRHGHCEYFASAGVLLMRAAGIPARYATGFAVTEFSPLVGHHVVRRRHAHAWVLAWDGEGWRDLDFTPSAWATLEEEQAARWWQPITDLAARLSFAFQRWRWRQDDAPEDWTLWLLPPLVALLIWRLAGQRRVRRNADGDASGGPDPELPETPLMRLYPALTHRLGPRARGETLLDWIGRTEGQADVSSPLPGRELRAAVALHNRLRFRGTMKRSERERLARLCEDLAGRLAVGR